VPTLQEGGYLFLASSEMPLISHAHLVLQEYEGVYFFHKKTLQEKRQGLIFDQHVLHDITTPISTTPSKTPGPRPRKNKSSVDPEEILLLANQKLNNHLFSAPKNPNYAIALTCLHLVVLVNEKNLEEARKVVAQLFQESGRNEVSCYLAGYVDMIGEHPKSAIKLFRQALHHNSSFWPARFYLTMLLRQSRSRNASQEFVTCCEDISAYIRQNKRDYQCLLEGFNAKYFLNMCQKLMS
jgi:hypothetical protein